MSRRVYNSFRIYRVRKNVNYSYSIKWFFDLRCTRQFSEHFCSPLFAVWHVQWTKLFWSWSGRLKHKQWKKFFISFQTIQTVTNFEKKFRWQSIKNYSMLWCKCLKICERHWPGPWNSTEQIPLILSHPGWVQWAALIHMKEIEFHSNSFYIIKSSNTLEHWLSS